MICQVAELAEVAPELIRWTVPCTETADRTGMGHR
jgi:hypothetical protein